MKYAIIADIHANLGALHAVLRDAEQQGCTRTACLGDIVGYYDKPKECLDIIRGMNIPCVKGNHVQYCSEDGSGGCFNPRAAEIVRWTREQLTEEDKRWLRNLPMIQVVAGFTIVHGTLDGPERWGYVFDRLASASSLMHQQTPVCFFGHTHLPMAFVRDSAVRGGTYSKFRVESGKQYFINVGSVGQPREGDRRAAYVVYDLDETSIELRRIDCPPPEFPPLGDGGVRVPKPPGGPLPSLSEAKEIE